MIFSDLFIIYMSPSPSSGPIHSNNSVNKLQTRDAEAGFRQPDGVCLENRNRIEDYRRPGTQLTLYDTQKTKGADEEAKERKRIDYSKPWRHHLPQFLIELKKASRSALFSARFTSAGGVRKEQNFSKNKTKNRN